MKKMIAKPTAAKLRRILVPTDHSEAAMQALDRATVLAALHGAELVVFHASTEESDADAFPAARRQAVLERIEAAAPGNPPQVHLSGAAGEGPFRGVLGAIEKHAPDLVVMATHGGGLMSGSVAEQVAWEAACDVLVARRDARGRWPAEPGAVVVPVDFSEPSRRALELARGWVDDASITVVHVVEAPTRPEAYARAVATPFERDPSLQDTVRAHLAQWAAPLQNLVVAEGDVHRTLLQQVSDLDAVLVIVGTRGVHSFPETLTGGTAQFLTRHADAPVLTVR